MSKLLKNIPTNIITGFLGAGKTTAILNLLEQKPEHERWAILVNEFGEVGIDGELLAKEGAQQDNVFIREVPGGCMCCAAGLPMQVALTLLLSEARPDRLLIEPTGLGHPKEVMALLKADHYRDVLTIQRTVTLIDARQLNDARYTEHAVFKQQLEIADIIVANKTDQYQPADYVLLQRYLENHDKCSDKTLYHVQRGRLALDCLQGKAAELGSSATKNLLQQHEFVLSTPEPLFADLEFPDSGFLSVNNHGSGYFSQGWVFDSRYVFDYELLYEWLAGLAVERMKGMFMTQQGGVLFNQVNGFVTQKEIADISESRVELIALEQNLLSYEAGLLACALR